MKSKKIITTMILFIAIFSFSALLPTTGDLILAYEGNGTASSPYLIRTTEDLLEIPDYSSDYFKLANDIDFGNSNIETIGVFSGTLDGSGYSIKNFNIVQATSRKVGLFSELVNATIINLTFENSKVYIQNQDYIEYGGLLAATAINSEISVQMKDFQVYAYNMWYVGGIVGRAENTIFYDCLGENPIIHGYSTTGMLCASLVDSQMRNCRSVGGNGSTNFGSIGGLVGSANNSSLYQCSSTTDTSTLTKYGSNAGGLVGATYSNVTITECYSKNKSESVSAVGGIVGMVCGDNLVIENCYTDSTYGSWYEAGGLVGGLASGSQFDITISNCYCILTPNNSITLYAFSNSENVMNISNSYYDKDLIELANPLSCGRTTSEMYQQSNYVGWDFDHIWCIDEGNGYPRLQFEN